METIDVFVFLSFQMARTPITQEKVHKAKLSIENFYANLVNQYEEREERYRRLEEMMNAEGLSDQEVKYFHSISIPIESI